MARVARNRMAIRLSTELQVALALSAEKSGLPVATQAMLLLRQALARTMESKEYAERITKAKVARTHAEYLHDMNVAAEGLAGEQRTYTDCRQPGVAEQLEELVSAAEELAREQEGRQGSLQAGAAAQDAGPVQA